ncbi:MAG: hypothetical protein JXM69_02905 [Anaerolineae bacterium]|nr:hypothetical protein [Anaerolineae bacterium]
MKLFRKADSTYIRFTLIACVFVVVVFIILAAVDAISRFQINKSGTISEALVINIQNELGVCSVEYAYKVPDQVKGFVLERDIACSNDVFRNLKQGSQVTIKYLSSNPASSDLVGNAPIWWMYLVRTLASVLCVLSTITFFVVETNVQTRFPFLEMIIGGIACSIAGASLMIGLSGFEYLDGVLIMAILCGLFGPMMIQAAWGRSLISRLIDRGVSRLADKYGLQDLRASLEEKGENLINCDKR